jgi:hypothetical protein
MATQLDRESGDACGDDRKAGRACEEMERFSSRAKANSGRPGSAVPVERCGT